MSEEWFHFECVSTLLPDATFVTLAEVIEDRWVCRRMHVYAAIGPYHALLYRINDGRFLFARYQVEHWEPIEEHDAKVGRGTFIEPLREVPPVFAAKTLLDWQMDVPADLQQVLQEAMKPKPKPAPRPLEYWAKYFDLSHELDAVDENGVARSAEKELNCVLEFAVSLVQRVRRGFNSKTDSHCLLFLGHRLHDRYKVDRAKWTGDRETIPPASIGILDFSELKDAIGVRHAHKVLTELLTPICTAGDAILGPPIIDDAPTWDERELFPSQVNAILPELEHTVGEFQKAVLSWIAKRATVEEHPPKAARLKMPSKEDFIAYRIFAATGCDHQKVADLLLSECKIQRNRGTVSRMISRVARWIAAGNVLPEVPPPKGRAKSIDPTKLELGKNLENRPVHHRDARSENSD